MTNLTPGRRARLDQILTRARDQSIRQNAIVTVVASVDGDRRCSWCDCPVIDHSGGRIPATCKGCKQTATEAVHQYNPGGDYRGNIPICDLHMDDFIDTYHQLGGTPKVVLYDPKPWKKAKR
jgi:hypothetical protein